MSQNIMELGAGATLGMNNTVQVCNCTTKISCFQAVHFPSARVGFFKPIRRLQRHQSFRICAKDAPISEAELKKVSLVHNDNLGLSSLTAVSPLDGRYSEKVKELRFFCSEYGLIRYRVLVEVRWLLKLSEIPEVIEVPNFSNEAKLFLENLVLNFSPDDASEVKKIEKVTNHDVKAVEYFLKEKCRPHVEVGKVLEFFHFACTSEDINNLAHGLMLRDAVNLVMLPIIDELIYVMSDMATKTSNISMLSRTHGQAASPTTLGKELAVFSFRLNNQKKLISQVKLLGKFAGAVGNYNAHLVAYPNIDWPRIAEEFVESLGISFNPYVTQIEPHDYIAELFPAIARFNNILVDFDRDIWGYISLGYFKQPSSARRVLSTTAAALPPVVVRSSSCSPPPPLLCLQHLLRGISKTWRYAFLSSLFSSDLGKRLLWSCFPCDPLHRFLHWRPFGALRKYLGLSLGLWRFEGNRIGRLRKREERVRGYSSKKSMVTARLSVQKLT